ncbi:hypothetical protein AwWohl_08840 [Gammaproteobacteria bacterium]|nr:hypothetical protein AwWohl_08840 [Gammaproteobacteria bacterium]
MIPNKKFFLFSIIKIFYFSKYIAAVVFIIMSLEGCIFPYPYSLPYKYDINAIIVNGQPCFYVDHIDPLHSNAIRYPWYASVSTIQAGSAWITNAVYWERNKIKHAVGKESCVSYGSGVYPKVKSLELMHPYLVNFNARSPSFARLSFCLSRNINNELVILETIVTDNELKCGEEPVELDHIKIK